jgi:hypothetical protein
MKKAIAAGTPTLPTKREIESSAAALVSTLLVTPL